MPSKAALLLGLVIFGIAVGIIVVKELKKEPFPYPGRYQCEIHTKERPTFALIYEKPRKIWVKTGGIEKVEIADNGIDVFMMSGHPVVSIRKFSGKERKFKYPGKIEPFPRVFDVNRTYFKCWNVFSGYDKNSIYKEEPYLSICEKNVNGNTSIVLIPYNLFRENGEVNQEYLERGYYPEHTELECRIYPWEFAW